MHMRRAAQLPQARIRLVVKRGCTLAQRLQPPEQALIAAVPDALVEKQVGRGEHGRAEYVVLDLEMRLVADAHRPHAAISGERADFALVHSGIAADTVYG